MLELVGQRVDVGSEPGQRSSECARRQRGASVAIGRQVVDPPTEELDRRWYERLGRSGGVEVPLTDRDDVDRPQRSVACQPEPPEPPAPR